MNDSYEQVLFSESKRMWIIRNSYLITNLQGTIWQDMGGGKK